MAMALRPPFWLKQEPQTTRGYYLYGPPEVTLRELPDVVVDCMAMYLDEYGISVEDAERGEMTAALEYCSETGEFAPLTTDLTPWNAAPMGRPKANEITEDGANCEEKLEAAGEGANWVTMFECLRAEGWTDEEIGMYLSSEGFGGYYGRSAGTERAKAGETRFWVEPGRNEPTWDSFDRVGEIAQEYGCEPGQTTGDLSAAVIDCPDISSAGDFRDAITDAGFEIADEEQSTVYGPPLAAPGASRKGRHEDLLAAFEDCEGQGVAVDSPEMPACMKNYVSWSDVEITDWLFDQFGITLRHHYGDMGGTIAMEKEAIGTAWEECVEAWGDASDVEAIAECMAGLVSDSDRALVEDYARRMADTDVSTYFASAPGRRGKQTDADYEGAWNECADAYDPETQQMPTPSGTVEDCMIEWIASAGDEPSRDEVRAWIQQNGLQGELERINAANLAAQRASAKGTTLKSRHARIAKQGMEMPVTPQPPKDAKKALVRARIEAIREKRRADGYEQKMKQTERTLRMLAARRKAVRARKAARFRQRRIGQLARTKNVDRALTLLDAECPPCWAEIGKSMYEHGMTKEQALAALQAKLEMALAEHAKEPKTEDEKVEAEKAENDCPEGQEYVDGECVEKKAAAKTDTTVTISAGTAAATPSVSTPPPASQPTPDEIGKMIADAVQAAMPNMVEEVVKQVKPAAGSAARTTVEAKGDTLRGLFTRGKSEVN